MARKSKCLANSLQVSGLIWRDGVANRAKIDVRLKSGRTRRGSEDFGRVSGADVGPGEGYWQ